MNDEQEQPEQPITFPHYPQGIPVAEHKQNSPLTRMLNKGFKPKMKARMFGKMKGLQSDQQVHVKHKKVKFY